MSKTNLGTKLVEPLFIREIGINKKLSNNDEIIKFNKAKNAYIAGHLDSWAIILEENPEMQSTIIKDMKEMANSLKKSAGVVILKDAN